MKNATGYWTGTFEGTNNGGISFDIKQDNLSLAGIATMYEQNLGTYKYRISGEMGTPVELQLVPDRESFMFRLGVLHVTGTILDNGILTGRWHSSIGTNGIFTARRYSDENKTEPATTKSKTAFISYCHDDTAYLGSVQSFVACEEV